VISTETKPRLAQKTRLHFDRHTNRHLLLYPEKGLVLNPTATEIVKLCDGARTVSEIVVDLAARYDAAPRDVLEKEVFGFLNTLREKGLLEDPP